MSELAKTVKVTLDRERTMHWGIREMRWAEEELPGLNFLLNGLSDGMRMSELTACLYASLRRDDKALTYEKCCDILNDHLQDAAKMTVLINSLMEVMKANRAQESEDPTKASEAPANP